MSERPRTSVYRFGDFVLDEDEKQLRRGEERLAISPRYFDALLLLARNPGTLITKDRFFDEVWTGVTVGDEALTQCIKSLRRTLEDEHRDPRYIATVPKRGYRFVAPVEAGAPQPVAPPDAVKTPNDWISTPLRVALAGTVGGGAAGIVGGLIYGVLALGGGGGAISTLFVLTALTALVGTLGAFGVSFGMAVGSIVARRKWAFSIVGAASGGMLVGAAFNILGTDSLYLLFGRAPDGFTGGIEGAILGAVLAAGARLGGGLAARGWRPAIVAGISSAVAGALISLAGGKLMGGSLAAVARSYDGSRLELDAIGRLSGEALFGPVAQTIAAGAEGLLFGASVVAAMLAWQRLGPRLAIGHGEQRRAD